MIIFAGGGSGGHIVPALAIHDELPGREPAVFVCSDRPLDSEMLKREGVEFCVVPAKPVSRRVRGLIRFLRGWGPSVRIGRELIRRGKAAGERVIVVATGGFVAAPIAAAARAEGVPLILVNLDAVPGKANRLIARRATKLYSSMPVVGPSAALAWNVVRPIVRRHALVPASPAECRRALGLDPSLRTLLVTGGSQGAVSINRIMMRAVREHGNAFAGWQVIHQAGRNEEQPLVDAYRGAGIRAAVRAFFERMGESWTASDLAVSRAGAGGVAEAWGYRVPTLFLPNPYHRDQHQRHNAARLVEAGAALISTDRIEEPLQNEAIQTLTRVLAEPTRLREVKSRLEALGPADGAADIARELTAND